MDIDRFDRQLARYILEFIIVCRKRAVFQVNTVLARMNRALCVTRWLGHVRNRGIGNRSRDAGRHRRLAVREIRECDTCVARVAVCRAVVVHGLRLSCDRNFTRHDAVVDRDLVVEIIVPLIGNLLIGNGRIRSVGMCARPHIDIGKCIRHRTVRRIDVGIDIRQLRRAEIVRTGVNHMVADIVDLRLVECTALGIPVINDVETCRRVEEGRIIIAVGTG